MKRLISPRTFWTLWPLALPTLGTQIGIWRVIASKPGALLLILNCTENTK